MNFLRLPALTLVGFILIGISAPQAADMHVIGADPAADADHVIVVDEQGQVHAEEHGDGHESSGGLPQFNPSSYPSQIFWLVVVFSVMYFFFSRRTLPEISGVIENRHQHIQSDLDSAEKLRQEAETVHKAYDEALDKARTKASDLFAEVEREIKEKSAAQFQAFLERSSKEVKSAEAKIEKAKSEAFEEMSTVAAEVAAKAAEKIIGVSTDLQKAKSIIDALHKNNKKAA
ncbi:MAG TPA: hypothetical protein DEA55_10180 [Rhodospirillaceae bacterium]|nr:hypothetical protein [Rhodospirillaceae bacterium]